MHTECSAVYMNTMGEKNQATSIITFLLAVFNLHSIFRFAYCQWQKNDSGP